MKTPSLQNVTIWIYWNMGITESRNVFKSEAALQVVIYKGIVQLRMVNGSQGFNVTFPEKMF